MALKSSGIEDILVIERAKALRSKSQGAIRLTKEGLNSLGIIYPSLPETLRSIGANFEKSIAKEALNNGTVTYIKGEDPNQGIGILIAWADIQNSLANAINEISNDEYWLRCGSGIKSYNEKGDKVEVQLEDGSIITTSLLVGGDGIFSTIRRHIKAPLLDMPRSYSQTNWNANNSTIFCSGKVSYSKGHYTVFHILYLGHVRVFTMLILVETELSGNCVLQMRRLQRRLIRRVEVVLGLMV